MPTVKLLRTTVGGYEFINLTSTMLASFLRRVDLSAQVDGVKVEFNTDVSPVPYIAGTLEVLLGGVEQNSVTGVSITEDPSGGKFTLNFAPDATMLPLIVRYIVA